MKKEDLVDLITAAISFLELRSPWPAVGKRELWEHPFSNNNGNNRILHIRFYCACVRSAQLACMVSMAHTWNGCSQSSRFPTAGQGERSSGNEIDGQSTINLVSRGPFCHALEKSGSLARSNDIPVLNGSVNTIDWDQNQSDLSDLTLSMRRVTGSLWIANFWSL